MNTTGLLRSTSVLALVCGAADAAYAVEVLDSFEALCQQGAVSTDTIVSDSVAELSSPCTVEIEDGAALTVRDSVIALGDVDLTIAGTGSGSLLLREVTVEEGGLVTLSTADGAIVLEESSIEAVALDVRTEGGRIGIRESGLTATHTTQRFTIGTIFGGLQFKENHLTLDGNDLSISSDGGEVLVRENTGDVESLFASSQAAVQAIENLIDVDGVLGIRSEFGSIQVLENNFGTPGSAAVVTAGACEVRDNIPELTCESPF